MSPLAMFALAGVGTYLIRASSVVAGRTGQPSPRVREALRLIAPSVLAAIVADRLFLDGGELSVDGAWLVAAVVAAAAALKWRSAAITMSLGMLAVWLVGWLT